MEAVDLRRLLYRSSTIERAVFRSTGRVAVCTLFFRVNHASTRFRRRRHEYCDRKLHLKQIIEIEKLITRVLIMVKIMVLALERLHREFW